MEILGVGPTEFIFIILIAIIVLGPKDMQKAGKTIGRWLNQLRTSDGWKVFQQTSRELRNLPDKLMRDANMEIWETEQKIRGTIDPRSSKPTSSPSQRSSFPSSNEPESARPTHPSPDNDA